MTEISVKIDPHSMKTFGMTESMCVVVSKDRNEQSECFDLKSPNQMKNRLSNGIYSVYTFYFRWPDFEIKIKAR